MDEDQSTKKFFGGATKNKSENMDEDQSTKKMEGHFKTIGKWVQKRQTLIFTVANFSITKNVT